MKAPKHRWQCAPFAQFALPAIIILCGFVPIASHAQAPTGLATVSGDQQVLLTWTAVAGAVGYKIYRATSSGGTYNQVGPAGYVTLPAACYLDTDDTGAVINTLTNGSTYYYKVSWVNSSGTESAKSSFVSASPAAQDGTWTFTFASPTYSSPVRNISSTQATLATGSPGAAAVASVVKGVFSIPSGTPLQTSASATGTLTATWTPGHPGSIPTLFVLKDITANRYMTAVNDVASGTVSTVVRSSTVLASAPPSTSSRTVVAPSPSWNLSDPTKIIETMTSSQSEQIAGQSDVENNSTSVITMYTAAYFTTHSTTITLPTVSQSLTAKVYGSSSHADGLASAYGVQSESISGK